MCCLFFINNEEDYKSQLDFYMEKEELDGDVPFYIYAVDEGLYFSCEPITKEALEKFELENDVEELIEEQLEEKLIDKNNIFTKSKKSDINNIIDVDYKIK